MNVLSRYSFIQAYNTDQITQQKALEIGLSTTEIEECDADGNGTITVEEILADDDVCAKIIAAINAQQKTDSEVPTAPDNAETADTEFAGNQFAMAA
ncbi:MAG: hypothetical protein LUB59_02475 [Candidatus Gastranaerophilales bacterium]|nr:hypothetical protein [Candidatus Gastranaerophilales bacterium]